MFFDNIIHDEVRLAKYLPEQTDISACLHHIIESYILRQKMQLHIATLLGEDEMKKAICILLVFTLVACAQPPSGSPSGSAPLIDETFNAAISLNSTMQIGKMAFDDEWIYYINETGNPSSLYRVRYDGSESQLLTEHAIGNLNLVGDTIYYNQRIGYGVTTFCSVTTDGKDKKEIIEAASCRIAGESIYFLQENDDDTLGICRAALDGTIQKTHVFELAPPTFFLGNTDKTDNLNVGALSIHNGYFYVAVSRQQGVSNVDGFYRLAWGDDTAIQVTWGAKIGMYQNGFGIDGDTYVYMPQALWLCHGTIEDARNGDSFEYFEGRSYAIDSFWVEDGWIYYIHGSASSSAPVLYKMRIDGTDQQEIAQVEADRAYTLYKNGDWLYYRTNSDSHFLWYKVNVDGSGSTLVDITQLLLLQAAS